VAVPRPSCTSREERDAMLGGLWFGGGGVAAVQGYIRFV
jgi:hypothetical protein